MANQFIARKGLIALADSQITGSLNISQNIVAGGTVQATFDTSTATAISGAFDSVSSSLATRIASQEAFSSSLDATFATDAQVATAVAGLNAASSSYLLNTTDTFTGTLNVDGAITVNDTIAGNFTTNYDTKVLVGGEIIARSLTANESMVSIGGDTNGAFIKSGKQDGSLTDRPLNLITGEDIRLSISSTGKVAINGDSTDGFLEVRQSDNTPSIRLNNGSNPNGAYYDILSYTSGNLYLNRNGSTVVTLSDTNGNLGIGTTSPKALLDISRNAGADPSPVDNPVTLRLTDSGNAANGLGDTTNPWAEIQFYSEDASSGGPAVQAKIATIYDDVYSAGSHIVFYNTATPTNGLSERMRILSSGRIDFYTPNATTTAFKLNSANSTTGHATYIGSFSDNLYLSSNWYYAGGQQKTISGNSSANVVVGGGSTDALGYVAFGIGTTGAASPSEKARFDNDGLKFNGDTAAANALDDYEEGTWTPAVYAGGVSIINQAARYTKIGNSVTVHAYITVASTGDASGLILSGLPYGALGVDDIYPVGAADLSRCSVVGAIARVEYATNRISFYVSSGSTSLDRVQIKGNQIGNSGYIIFTVTYTAA